MSTTILAASTAAGTSSSFAVGATAVTVSVFLNSPGALSPGVVAGVEQQTPAGWQPAYAGGVPLVLTENQRQAVIAGPGTYRVQKGATTQAVGVFTDEAA